MMREKQRYLLVEAMSSIEGDERAVNYALSKELSRVIGESHFHVPNPRVVKVLDRTHFILRASLEGTGEVITALAFIKRANSLPNAFYTLKSSGTIKTLNDLYASLK